MTIPTYEWFIDWADDDYASFQAAIPERHIVSYAYDSGNVLDVGGQLSGVDAGSGQITLLDTRGTYWGTGALDADVLDKPHAFKLLIDGEGYAEGRATPVLGISVGAQVRPVTWRLAGGIETNLRSYGQVEGVTGTLAQVTQKLSELSGLDISTTSELPVGKGVTLATNWGGIINRIATLTGTWPAVVPGNAIELLSASDVIARTSLVTIGEADNLTMRETGVGVAHGLALTRYVLPGYANVDDQVLITGADEDRYGRKVLQIPDWFTEKELPYVLAALQRWAQPPTLVQFEMEDDYATPERAKAVVAAATVGSVVNVVLPDRTGADVTYKTAILGLGLRGGYRSKPTRIVRGLSQLFDPGPPPIPGRGGYHRGRTARGRDNPGGGAQHAGDRVGERPADDIRPSSPAVRCANAEPAARRCELGQQRGAFRGRPAGGLLGLLPALRKRPSGGNKWAMADGRCKWRGTRRGRPATLARGAPCAAERSAGQHPHPIFALRYRTHAPRR